MNWKGIVLLIVILVIVDLGVAFGLSPALTPAITAVINKNVDAKVDIKTLRLHPFLFSVTAEEISGSNPQNPNERIFYAKSLNARLDPIALLSRKVFLSNLTLDQAEVEVTKNASGELNVEQMADTQDGGRLETIQQWLGQGRRDWFGNMYSRVRKWTESREEKKSKEKKADKEILDLPKGRQINFAASEDMLFRIGKLRVTNAKVVLQDNGRQIPPFENVNLVLEDLEWRRSGAMSFDHIGAKGKMKTAREGSFDIDVRNHKGEVNAKAELKDMDLGPLQPLYEDSLPVTFNRGYLTLNSQTKLQSGSIDSSNDIKLEDFQMAAKGGFDITGFSTQTIVEVLNTLPKVELSFRITGDPARPSFEGFQASLMKLVGQDLQKGLASGLKDKAGDAFDKLKGKFGDLF